VLALTATMPIQAPVLGSYGVGDDVSVALADPLVPAALQAQGRLTGLSCDAGAGTAAWTVTIALPAPHSHASLAAQLKQLRRQITGTFHNDLAAPPGGINP